MYGCVISRQVKVALTFFTILGALIFIFLGLLIYTFIKQQTNKGPITITIIPFCHFLRVSQIFIGKKHSYI